MDEFYGVPRRPEPKPAPRSESDIAEKSPADKVKAALEAKRKMMIVTALDKGTISLDGDYLRVEYDSEHGACKTEIEARDKRNAIEDACEQVFGRRLTLKASIAGQTSGAENDRDRGGVRNIGAASSSERRPQRKEKSKGAVEDDPKLRALVDKFHGEVIEVIKPEE